jgi:hypothetical protein
MQVRNRYGGIQNLPDRVARALIKAGTVTPVDKPQPIAPEPTPKPKAAKAKKAEE